MAAVLMASNNLRSTNPLRGTTGSGSSSNSSARSAPNMATGGGGPAREPEHELDIVDWLLQEDGASAGAVSSAPLNKQSRAKTNTIQTRSKTSSATTQATPKPTNTTGHHQPMTKQEPQTLAQSAGPPQQEEEEEEEQKKQEEEDAARVDEKELKRRTRRRLRTLQEKHRVLRKQQGIELMRRRVEELQQQFDQLCNQADERKQRQQVFLDRCMNHNNSNSSMRALLQSSESDSGLTSSMLMSFQCLAQEMSRLRHENEHLRDLVDKNLHFHHTLQNLVTQTDIQRPIQRLGDIAVSSQHDFLFYRPFSEEECYEIIRQDYEQNVVHKPNFFDETINKKLPIGWHGFARVENISNVRFQQTKLWSAKPPHEVFDLLWKVLNNPAGYAHVYSLQLSMELLQTVTKDIVIYRRIVRNVRNRTVNYSVHLLYRTQIDDETFVIGTVPLPLWGSGPRLIPGDPFGRSLLPEGGRLLLPQFHVLFKPEGEIPSSSGSSMPATRVFRWGYYGCDTAEDAAFWEKEVLEIWIRFEFLLLFPLINITHPTIAG